jgi:hypothetical protein
MSAAVKITQTEHTASELRGFAARSRDTAQSPDCALSFKDRAPEAGSVSANLRQKPAFIARQAGHHCAPLQIAIESPIDGFHGHLT